MILKNLGPSFFALPALIKTLRMSGLILALHLTKYSRIDRVEIAEDNF